MDRRLAQSKFVKAVLEEEKFPCKGMHKGKASNRSNSENRGSVEGCGKAKLGSQVQVNAPKTQEGRENRSWEMFSLEEIFTSLERMPQPPSVESFTCILQKCRKNRNLAYAKRLHAHMCKTGLEAHTSLGNYLVPMWVEVGSLCDAEQVFNRLVDRNEHSWTSLITGYIECGESQHALNLYQKMQKDCVHPSAYTFVALLKACARLKDVERGQKLHAAITRKGLEENVFLGSTLVDMYAKCGLLAKAQEVFDNLSVRDVVSWTALIAGYAEQGLGKEALNCLEQMQLEGISPNVYTYVCSLKACAITGAIDKGGELHTDIGRNGLESNPFVGNALVDMYAKCGMLAKAWEVFVKLPVRDAVSWTALIAGYSEHGLDKEALNLFEQMQLEGVSPNAITFVYTLKACGDMGFIDKAQKIHVEIARKELERDIFVGSALVDMYVKFGLLAKSREVFDKLPVRDVVVWTALIAGYAKLMLGEEALDCFECMQLEGFSPDVVTFVHSLKACGSIGAADKGQEIHADIARKGLEREIFIGSALIDMYAKCGCPTKAKKVFEELPIRNEVSWNALITGYAILGTSDKVFELLERMIADGINPDEVTLLSVLTVCSHTGLVDKGLEYFDTMSENSGISPTMEHHTCMVDLLGRAGQLDKAVMMMKKMPFHPDLMMWHTILGSCRQRGNVELGGHAFRHAVQLDEKDAAAYVLMSNIYADAIHGGG